MKERERGRERQREGEDERVSNLRFLRPVNHYSYIRAKDKRERERERSTVL